MSKNNDWDSVENPAKNLRFLDFHGASFFTLIHRLLLRLL